MFTGKKANTKTAKPTNINGMLFEKNVFAGHVKHKICSPVPEFAHQWKKLKV